MMNFGIHLLVILTVSKSDYRGDPNIYSRSPGCAKKTRVDTLEFVVISGKVRHSFVLSGCTPLIQPNWSRKTSYILLPGVLSFCLGRITTKKINT
jgi:hypothetical protein